MWPRLIFTVTAVILIENVSSQKNEYHQSLQSQNYDPNAPLHNNRAFNIETSLNTNNLREQSSSPGESNDIANEDDDDFNTVPGVPGKDYPNYKTIPQTSFVCMNKKPGGYYADMETGCQVFHVCNARGVKSSFLCSPGSIFNQKYFVCDWWYDVECDNASDFYSLNDQLNRSGAGFDSNIPEPNYVDNNKYQSRNSQDSRFNSIDLSLASSGFNVSNYPINVSNDYREKNAGATNFTWNSIDSDNRRDDTPLNMQPDIVYLSKSSGERRQSSSAKVQSFNKKPQISFNRENQATIGTRQNSEKNAFAGEFVLDNVPRGFTKGFDDKRSNFYLANDPNYIDRKKQQFARQQLPYQNQDNIKDENTNSFKYFQQQSKFEENRNNMAFDKQEQANFVSTSTHNHNDEYYNGRLHEFITPPLAPDQNPKNFNSNPNFDVVKSREIFFDQQNQFNFDGPLGNSESQQENQFSDHRSESEPGIIYANDNDDFERKKQKEVDDAMLCKNHNSNEDTTNTEEFVFHDDEADRLMYEKLPSKLESLYAHYNHKLQSQEQKNNEFQEPPFLTDQTFPSSADDKKGLYSLNKKKNNPGFQSPRPSGRIQNGPGNGFPSSNRELVGSNAIAGTVEPKLSPDQNVDYNLLQNHRISQFGLDVNSLSH